MNMTLRFYTPCQIRDLAIDKGVEFLCGYGIEGGNLSAIEHTTKQLQLQGYLHRSIFVGSNFRDINGCEHAIGYYGTSDAIPHFGVSGFPIRELYSLDGTLIPLEMSLHVEAEGFNSPPYSVNSYLDSLTKAYSQKCSEFGAMFSQPSESLEPYLDQLVFLGQITESRTIRDALDTALQWHQEIERLERFKNRSPMFGDLWDLMCMADRGEFAGMAQGTKSTGQNKNTISGVINCNYDTFSASDSHTAAKMVNQVSSVKS